MENKGIQLLIIPGLGGSDEKHWQSFWATKYDNSVRLLQDDWHKPNLESWLKRLDDSILKLDGTIILVAHSLAVSLVLHWVNSFENSKVKGAFLVAPADVDSASHTPEVVRAFAPMPTTRLPFPSIVVASTNDTFVSIDRAKYFAALWGSDFINIGPKGHINSNTDLRFWEEGQLILQKLII